VAQRIDLQDLLPFDAERLSAGGQDGDSRALPQHLVEQCGRLAENVLAVVEDEQHLTVPQILDHGLLDRRTLALLELQRGRNRMADGAAVLERRELAHPLTVGVPDLHAGRGFDRKPSLAHAPDAGERHHGTRTECGDDPLDGAVAADEARRPPGQVGGRGGTVGRNRLDGGRDRLGCGNRLDALDNRLG
jgi:hypothetical protein